MFLESSEGAMGILARLQYAEGVRSANADPLPLKPFTATADETKLQEEVAAAIAELNAAAQAFSASKSFCRDYLDLVRQAEGYAAERRWGEAHRTLWAATFFVNRARETRGAARLRTWVAITSVGWLLLLFGLGAWLKGVEGQPGGQAVFGLSYWRYPLMGALGGVTIVVWGLIKHTIDLDFSPDYLGWYFFKPILGAVMGLIAVLAILAGFVAIQGGLTPTSYLPLYIVAFLTGFSERFFIRIIDRVTTALFGGEQTAPPDRRAAAPVVTAAAAGGARGSSEKGG